MKKTILTILLSALSMLGLSQNQVAKIKFQQAEEAYSNGKYREALDYVLEAEKIIKTSTTTTIYLKILCQNNLIKPNPLKEFDLLNSLRENCNAYLIAADGNLELEDKYKEVYFISESIKKYPKTKAEYDTLIRKQEEERKEQELIEAQQREKENQRKRELQLQKEEEERLRKEKEMQKINYAAVRFGLTLPLSSKSKDMISLYQWNSANESPFASAIRKGEFGLTLGATTSVNGLAGINKLSEKFNNKRCNVGILYDFSLTLEYYNLDDFKGYPSNRRWQFEDAKFVPFYIMGIGLGPDFSYRIGKKKSFFDVYSRLDFNVFMGGSYEAEEDNTNVQIEKTFREGAKIKLSPTLGLQYRFSKLVFGGEFRLKLIDKADYRNEYNVYKPISGYNYSSFKTNGLNLSYFTFFLGLVF